MNISQSENGCQKRDRGLEAQGLGIATKFVTPSKAIIDEETGEIVFLGDLEKTDSINLARKIRYELQDVSANILKNYYGKDVPLNEKGYKKEHRTCTCNRYKTSDVVSVLKSTEFKKAFYSGLMTCGNSRTCPVCSAVINERKSNEMRIATTQAEAMELHTSLLTFTVPHSYGDKIEDLLPRILEAGRKFFNGEPAKRFKEKYGIVGRIRSFEVRVGSNGWHPHFHILIFSKRPLPNTQVTKTRSKKRLVKAENQSSDWQWILQRWQNICLKSGLSAPNEYGLDIQDGSQAGEYISKFGGDGEILTTGMGKQITWDMCDEMTKGNVKMGRKGSRSPWDLLSDSVDTQYSEKMRSTFRKQFLSYARAIQGVNVIRWSTGLRDFFGLGKELTDDEIIKKQEDKSSLVARINTDQWKEILKRKQRPYVLELAELEDLSAFNNYILSLKRGSVLDARMVDTNNEKEVLKQAQAEIEISKRDKRVYKKETKEQLSLLNPVYESDAYINNKEVLAQNYMDTSPLAKSEAIIEEVIEEVRSLTENGYVLQSKNQYEIGFDEESIDYEIKQQEIFDSLKSRNEWAIITKEQTDANKTFMKARAAEYLNKK